VAGFVAAWRPFLITVSAGSLGLGYYRASRHRRGGPRTRLWLWITTPLTLLAWLLPLLGR
jgi:hypothetical protein